MTDRAVSVALSYVLVTSITVVLVGGLIIAGTSFVDTQRDTTVEQELTVVGNQLAGNVEQVDRLVTSDRSNDPDAASINETFQERVSGTTYQISLEDGDPPRLILTAPQADISVQVQVSVRTDVENSTASGGTVSVYYDDGELVIENA